MRGTSGRDAKIWRPLSRSTASAPDPAPAERICAPSALAGRAGARGARGGGQEERGRGEQHGDEAERPSHRAVESRQPAGRGEVAVAFRLPSRDSRRRWSTGGSCSPLLVAMFVLLGAGAGARGADLAGRRVAGRRRGRDGRPADVATDSGGNSVAVWAANPATGGEVRAAYRPRGGPWGAPESLDGALARSSSPAARRRAAGRGVRRRLAAASGDEHRAPLGAPPGGRRLERGRHDRQRRLLPGIGALAGKRRRHGDR